MNKAKIIWSTIAATTLVVSGVWSYFFTQIVGLKNEQLALAQQKVAPTENKPSSVQTLQNIGVVDVLKKQISDLQNENSSLTGNLNIAENEKKLLQIQLDFEKNLPALASPRPETPGLSAPNGIVTSGQSGGINTVNNIGTQERHLSDDQKIKLIALMRTFPSASIYFDLNGLAPDANDLANDISIVLANSGFKFGGGKTSINGGDGSGVNIWVVDQPDSPVAKALVDGLNEAGILAHENQVAENAASAPGNSLAAGSICIEIAPK